MILRRSTRQQFGLSATPPDSTSEWHAYCRRGSVHVPITAHATNATCRLHFADTDVMPCPFGASQKMMRHPMRRLQSPVSLPPDRRQIRALPSHLVALLLSSAVCLQITYASRSIRGDKPRYLILAFIRLPLFPLCHAMPPSQTPAHRRPYAFTPCLLDGSENAWQNGGARDRGKVRCRRGVRE